MRDNKKKAAYNKLFEKTPNGFLMRLYSNMRNRITGKNKRSGHLYVGKELLSREDFYTWAKAQKDFWRLYKAWVESDHDIRLVPSVNRIRSEIGYTENNMEWVTNSVNCSMSSVTKKRKLAEKQVIYKTLGIK